MDDLDNFIKKVKDWGINIDRNSISPEAKAKIEAIEKAKVRIEYQSGFRITDFNKND